ncbi:MAG: serine hydrolase [Oscillospiraceae bacterium]|nr:serine hydrolase [Oscillospiraceae bacterium]
MHLFPKIRLLSLAAVIFLAAIIPALSASAEGSVGIVLADAASGKILYEQSSKRRMPCGDLCKLMTVLIAAEECENGTISPDSLISVSERPENIHGAQIWLDAGDEIPFSELMAAVIIGNANDAAAVIAGCISGTPERFADMMNLRASQLGMNDTHYTDPCGNISDEAYTTAADTAKLLCELSRHTELTSVFTERLRYVKNGTVQLVNTNTPALHINGALGFRSGTAGSGNGLRHFAAEGAVRGKDCYVAAVIGSPDEDYAKQRASELIEYGFSAFETLTPALPDDLPREIAVKGGEKGTVRIAAADIRSMTIPRGTASLITSRTACPEYVYAPQAKGEKIGEILYYYDGGYVFSADVCARQTVKKRDIGHVMWEMLKDLLKFD